MTTRAAPVGPNTTFARIIRLVEKAQARPAQVLLADRFSAAYLPEVVTVATLTLVVRQDPLAAALVVPYSPLVCAGNPHRRAGCHRQCGPQGTGTTGQGRPLPGAVGRSRRLAP